MFETRGDDDDSVVNDDSDNATGGEMLGLQLAEFEMLMSMYSNVNELQCDDPAAIVDIQNVVDGTTKYDQLKSRIRFTLKICTDDATCVEMLCLLPHDYPSAAPQISLRCDRWSRASHQQLSGDVHAFVLRHQRQHPREICLSVVIDWLREHVAEYVHDAASADASADVAADVRFCRMWIYSHHIYNKTKRKAILENARRLQLSGFSVPGKPGIVVVEGKLAHVEEYWQEVRQMTWKKIVMKEREDVVLGPQETIDSYRKFDEFEEKPFQPRQSRGRGVHMDRGLLFRFLTHKGCAHIFPIFFDVRGTAANDSCSD